jgi:hypothetical protein
MVLFGCRSEQFPVNPVSQDEYEIYGILIDSLYVSNQDSVTICVTEDSTVINPIRGSVKVQNGKREWVALNEFAKLEHVCPSWKQLDHREFTESYARVNSRRSFFIADSIKTSLRCIQIAADSIRLIMKNGDWDLFYKTFPHSKGIIRFSRVGFNIKKDQAIVYVDHTQGSLIGVGYYVLLQKKDGSWHLRYAVEDWVS